MIESASIRPRLGLPSGTPLLMAAGDYAPGDGMSMAVWAYDILKYVAPELHLVLVGAGPGREAVVRFARTLNPDEHRVHFLTDDRPASVIIEADVVWGTHPSGGVPFLKAALVLGKPAVALRTRDTEGLEAAILTRPGDPVALATATRKVLAKLAPHSRPGVG
jgi:glycosyltransferase involved in cell wall biosynthesis